MSSSQPTNVKTQTHKSNTVPDPSLTPSMFTKLRLLGRGDISRVYLVVCPRLGQRMRYWFRSKEERENYMP